MISSNGVRIGTGPAFVLYGKFFHSFTSVEICLNNGKLKKGQMVVIRTPHQCSPLGMSALSVTIVTPRFYLQDRQEVIARINMLIDTHLICSEENLGAIPDFTVSDLVHVAFIGLPTTYAVIRKFHPK